MDENKRYVTAQARGSWKGGTLRLFLRNIQGDTSRNLKKGIWICRHMEANLDGCRYSLSKNRPLCLSGGNIYVPIYKGEIDRDKALPIESAEVSLELEIWI